VNRQKSIITTKDKKQNILLNHIGNDKNARSRINQFDAWMSSLGLDFLNVDLATYRDYLMSDDRTDSDDKPIPLSASSASSHMSTIRGAYQRLLLDNNLRDYLYEMCGENLPPADKKAFVDENIIRLTNAINSKKSTVKVNHKQDVADSKHLRLNINQVMQLLTQINTASLIGKRDLALISLMIATGLREFEAVNVIVDDLHQTLGGKLALRISKGKGNKQRLVPYGSFSNSLVTVDNWLSASSIINGYVFRSVDRHGNVSPKAMTERAVQNILKKYPVPVVQGNKTTMRKVKPHDLRRTYAKLQYTSGMDLLSIQQNLGHEDSKTTQGYIGAMDADKREPTLTLPLPVSVYQQAESLVLESARCLQCGQKVFSVDNDIPCPHCGVIAWE